MHGTAAVKREARGWSVLGATHKRSRMRPRGQGTGMVGAAARRWRRRRATPAA
jgi:hypothetical protein